MNERSGSRATRYEGSVCTGEHARDSHRAPFKDDEQGFARHKDQTQSSKGREMEEWGEPDRRMRQHCGCSTTQKVQPGESIETTGRQPGGQRTMAYEKSAERHSLRARADDEGKMS